jgi:hypothetical protein
MGNWAVDRGLSLSSSRREKYPVAKLECPLVTRSSIAPPKVGGVLQALRLEALQQ